MAWQAIQFKKPAALSAILNNGRTSLNAKTSQLDAVSSKLTGVPSIGSGGAGMSLPLIANADLFQEQTRDLHSVVIHPWCEGIGEGVGYHRYLAPANAVEAMAKKFSDSNDHLRPAQTLDALFLLVGANSPRQMGSALGQLLKIFAHPELQMCATRFESLAQLDQSKTILPDAAINACFHGSHISTSSSVRNCLAQIASVQAMLDGCNCDNDSAEPRLIALAAKKKAAIEANILAASNALNAFAGESGRRLFLSGQSTAQVRKSLLESGAGFSGAYSVCLGIIGSPGSLNILKDFF